MSMIFCDPFDQYNTLAELATCWNGGYQLVYGGTLTIGPAFARFSPGNGLDLYVKTGFGGGSAYLIHSYSNRVTVFASFSAYFATNLLGGQGFDLATFIETSVPHICFRVTSSLQIAIYQAANSSNSGAGVLLATSTATFSFNAWHRFEFKVSIDPTAGLAECYVDGVLFLTFSGATQVAGKGRYTNQFCLGQGAAGSINSSEFWIDDVLLYDDQGAAPNGYLGDRKLVTQFPSGAGASTQFTIGGSAPAASNWQSVDETPPDDGATLVTDGTVGHTDLYTFPAVTATTIDCVAVLLRSQKTDAAVRSLRAAAKSGSITTDNGSDFVQSSSWLYYQAFFPHDPNTSAAWTQAGLSAAQFGPKVTGGSPAILQKAQGYTGAGPTSITVAFPNPITTGSLLVAFAYVNLSDGPNTTISDTLGNTWTSARVGGSPPGLWDSAAAAFYCTSAHAGVNSVTVSSSGTNLLMLQIHEVSDVSGTLRTSGHASTSSSTPSVSTAAPAGLGVPAQVGDYAISFLWTTGGNPFTAGTGYTLQQQQQQPTYSFCTAVEDAVLAAAGDVTASFGLTGSTTWGQYLLVFEHL